MLSLDSGQRGGRRGVDGQSGERRERGGGRRGRCRRGRGVGCRGVGQGARRAEPSTRRPGHKEIESEGREESEGGGLGQERLGGWQQCGWLRPGCRAQACVRRCVPKGHCAGARAPQPQLTGGKRLHRLQKKERASNVARGCARGCVGNC
ncbi:MAG: hypothetical protein J3K34DRAFT_440439 [Monoraphidium minutum]|nr:MAG: hypothetical protein J3K34DRAFT_440439 [Monoraphidium minutum]